MAFKLYQSAILNRTGSAELDGLVVRVIGQITDFPSGNIMIVEKKMNHQLFSTGWAAIGITESCMDPIIQS